MRPAMKRLALLLLASLLLAQGPALARDRGDRDERREMQPRERARDDRRELRRERTERREQREHRFTREEREKLRQDLLDANRDLRRR